MFSMGKNEGDPLNMLQALNSIACDNDGAYTEKYCQ
jgi:hypothetical protein